MSKSAAREAKPVRRVSQSRVRLEVARPIVDAAIEAPGIERGDDRGAGDRRAEAARAAARAPARRRGLARLWAAGESLVMAGGGAAVAMMLWGSFETAQRDERVIPGVRLGGIEVGGLTAGELPAVAEAAATASLDRKLVLTAPGVEVATTARELGAVPSPDAAIAAALQVGRSGDLLTDLRARARAQRGELDLAVGHRFTEEEALARLLALAPTVERPSLPTRFDMEGAAHRAGDAWDPAVGVRLAVGGGGRAGLRGGSHRAGGRARADGRRSAGGRGGGPRHQHGAGELLDAVLDRGELRGPGGQPQGRGRGARRARAAAGRGDVVQRGVQRGGEARRTRRGVASAELIDTVGGGICQIASTIFGAGFFAGLEIVDARPHSRPSGYVDMGLDATVVWPSVDLVLRNQFEFPIVFHMTVSQGQVRAEVLGPRRPYQVAFERTLKESAPYESVVRDDPQLRLGSDLVVQRGMRGFTIERVRKLYQGGEIVETQVAELKYPATREIIRRGSNPTGEAPERKPLPALRDPVASMRIMQ